MQTITLSRGWTYRTPLVTVRYPAGKHSVNDEAAAAAEAAGVIAPPVATAERNNEAPKRERKARSMTDGDARRFAVAALNERKAKADGEFD